MNIARPAGGFKVQEPPEIMAELAKHQRKFPRILAVWDGIKDRLKMTAHKEGEPINNPANRVFEALGDAAGRVPTIRVAYHVLGDTLSFLRVLVIDP